MKSKKKKIMNLKGCVAMSAAIAIIFIACGEKKNKQDEEVNTIEKGTQGKEQTKAIADVAFSNTVTAKVFHDYQELRMALINSDPAKAKKAAQNISEGFSEVRKDMKLMVLAMATSDDIENQREIFSEFTEKVVPIFSESLAEGTIYKQFCPMAFEGEGGYWLSDTEEILNPYYGDKMLTCGMVTEEIE